MALLAGKAEVEYVREASGGGGSNAGVTAAKMAEELSDIGYDSSVLADAPKPGAKQPAAARRPPTAGSVSSSSSQKITAPSTRTATLKVGGMTCASCVGTVERALKALPGVVRIQVALLAGKAEVVYKPTDVTTAQLVSTVEDVGFESSLLTDAPTGAAASAPAASAGPNNTRKVLVAKTASAAGPAEGSSVSVASTAAAAAAAADPFTHVTLSVAGMTCTVCVGTVESAVKRLPGVRDVTVALLAGKAEVTLEGPEQATPEVVRDTIESVGFDATVLAVKQPRGAAGGGVFGSHVSKSSASAAAAAGGSLDVALEAVEEAHGGQGGKGEEDEEEELPVTAATVVIALQKQGSPGSSIPSTFVLQTEAALSVLKGVLAVDSSVGGAMSSSTNADSSSNSTSRGTWLQRLFSRGKSAVSDAAGGGRKKRRRAAAVPSSVPNSITVTYDSAVVKLRRLLDVAGDACAGASNRSGGVLAGAASAAGIVPIIVSQSGSGAPMGGGAGGGGSDTEMMKNHLAAERDKWRALTLWSALFAIPVFVMSMVVPWIDKSILLRWGEVQGAPGLWWRDVILMILTFPVQFIIGWRFIAGAWKGVVRGRCTMGMDFLVATGTTAAYFASLLQMILGGVAAQAALAEANGDPMVTPDMTGGGNGTVVDEPHAGHRRRLFVALVSVQRQLMATGMAGSTGGSEPAMTFFETSALLIMFVMLGKWLETVAKGKTSDALAALLDLQPSQALVVLEDEEEAQWWADKQATENADATAVDVSSATAPTPLSPTSPSSSSGGGARLERPVPLHLVSPGDLLKVLPGAAVPADGVVESGASEVNESMITGEPMPVRKEPGSEVVGATVNGSGLLLVRAARVGGDSVLSQIVKLVESAQMAKAPIQAFADRISGIFAPTVLVIAAATFVGWETATATGAVPDDWIPMGQGKFFFSLLFSIAVVVIACPCALGLATPTAVMVGTGMGARNGVLIKGGDALETAHRVNAVIFDKTGTLTEGKPSLTDVVLLPSNGISGAPQPGDGGAGVIRLLSLLASAESGSEHPLARAIVDGSHKVATEYVASLVEVEATMASAAASAPTSPVAPVSTVAQSAGAPGGLTIAAPKNAASLQPPMPLSLHPLHPARHAATPRVCGSSALGSPTAAAITTSPVAAAASPLASGGAPFAFTSPPPPSLELWPVDADSFEAVPGYGLTATVLAPPVPVFASTPLPVSPSAAAVAAEPAPVKVLIGNRAWMGRNGIPVPPSAESQLTRLEKVGRTAVLAAVDGSLRCVLGIADRVKPEAPLVVKALGALGVDVWLCTGDAAVTAAAVAGAVGIAPERVMAQVLPGDKASKVTSLQREGKTVAMVGDGINDSPALAAADVGMAIGAGAQIAVAAADVVLIRSDLRDVVTAIDLSRAVFRRIWANFVWALGYNALGIPLAAGVMFPVMRATVAPEVAGLAMAFSSVSVVLSSLWLKRYRKPDLVKLASGEGRLRAAATKAHLTALSASSSVAAKSHKQTTIATRTRRSSSNYSGSGGSERGLVSGTGELDPLTSSSASAVTAAAVAGGDVLTSPATSVALVDLSFLTPPCDCAHHACKSNKLEGPQDWDRAFSVTSARYQAALLRGGTGATPVAAAAHTTTGKHASSGVPAAPVAAAAGHGHGASGGNLSLVLADTGGSGGTGSLVLVHHDHRCGGECEEEDVPLFAGTSCGCDAPECCCSKKKGHGRAIAVATADMRSVATAAGSAESAPVAAEVC